MLNPLPKCWGVGISRTGTTSLCEALRLLGYESIRHNPDFSELKTLDGGADLGVIVFYKYLDYKYPGSKFVLTLRDDLEAWLRSTEYIFGVYPVRSRSDDVAIMRRMAVFETVRFDREKFIAAYHRHNDDVRRYFAQRPGDLLEMSLTAGEGWEKLCPFLGRPIPDVPFPHLNARNETAAIQRK
jgi:hypothetical protein